MKLMQRNVFVSTDRLINNINPKAGNTAFFKTGSPKETEAMIEYLKIKIDICSEDLDNVTFIRLIL